jgi:TldD protein
MLDKIKEQIERIKGMGATYVDTRWYPFEETNYLMMWNGNLKSTTSARESGVGIRVLYKGAWGFSASSDLSDLAALYDKAFDNARIAAERVTFPVRLAEKDAIQAKFESPCGINPFEVPLSDKVAFLKDMDQKLNQEGVFQRACDMTFVRKQIVFVDSEGSQIDKLIT